VFALSAEKHGTNEHRHHRHRHASRYLPQASGLRGLYRCFGLGGGSFHTTWFGLRRDPLCRLPVYMVYPRSAYSCRYTFAIGIARSIRCLNIGALSMPHDRCSLPLV
jgi:hypothetical protein